ncbi:metallophosphoesterase family protein [Sphingobacterium pedocola]|uniref:Calcineurin-like phosphoesterase domain-containing protein n=1 Tax=Sphingobacterium pedocola TaxID=2082722 RepID=A0ABR9T1Q5_9SPHI|nr:hypothetical protein [Sphingobacterium pedocola]MBE8719265.1 hypothetical protein [Sphingobacterium pedocola]
MNIVNRRDFLLKMGILSGSLLVGQKGFSGELDRTTRFSLRADPSNVHFYFTGNLHGDRTLLANLPNAIEAKQALWLDTGNFSLGTTDLRLIQQMNTTGYQVAAVGANEWRLGEDLLLRLAKQCQFTLVMSHGQRNDTEWLRWIKPYEIVNLGSNRIGIVALGPSTDVDADRLAWKQMHKWAQTLKRGSSCDYCICLVPEGYEKSFVMENIVSSDALDIVLCGALEKSRPAQYILKNRNKTDVICGIGTSEGNLVGKQVLDMRTPNLLLPYLLTHHPIKSVDNTALFT